MNEQDSVHMAWSMQPPYQHQQDMRGSPVPGQPPESKTRPAAELSRRAPCGRTYQLDSPEPRSRALEVNTKERVNLRSRPIASSRSLAEDNSIGNLRPKDQFRRLIGLCRRLEPRDVAYQAPTYNPPAGPFSQLDSILPSLTVTSHSESPAQLRSHIETAKRRSSLSSRGTVFPPSSSVAVNIGIKSPTLRTSESKTPPICLLFLL